MEVVYIAVSNQICNFINLQRIVCKQLFGFVNTHGIYIGIEVDAQFFGEDLAKIRTVVPE